MIKRDAMTAVLLAAGMTMSLIGYGSGTAGTTSVQDAQVRETVLDYSPGQSPEGETRIVMDHTGGEIEIPAKISRIVTPSLLPLSFVYSPFEGSVGKLMGIHPSSMAATENSTLSKVASDILSVNTDFLQGRGLNIEELLNLKSDIVFYSANNTEGYEKLATADIPAAGFSASSWDFDRVAAFENWVELPGGVLSQEDRAIGIADCGHQVYDEVQAILNGTGDIEKLRVLVLSNYADGVVKTPGSNFFGQHRIESAGDINVATDLAGTPKINMEQIYEWDPDVICITNSNPYLPEDLYDNAIEDHDWSSVKAVKEGKVYKLPLGTYRRLPPVPDTPLVLRWLVRKNRPQLFADVGMEQEVYIYYERFYNVALSDKDITQISNSAREAIRNQV